MEKCSNHLSKIIKEIVQENFLLEVPIFKQFHKFIIGKGGSNIKKIREETSTMIELPSEDKKSDVIRITGREENVMQAKVLQSIRSYYFVLNRRFVSLIF